MIRGNFYGFYLDSRDRIRYSKSLLTQVRAHLKTYRLLNRRELYPLAKGEEQDLVRILGWMRIELSMLKELGEQTIEGVSWGELDEVERVLRDRG